MLRFLAEDVIPRLELVRDRILDALIVTPIRRTHLTIAVTTQPATNLAVADLVLVRMILPSK